MVATNTLTPWLSVFDFGFAFHELACIRCVSNSQTGLCNHVLRCMHCVSRASRRVKCLAAHRRTLLRCNREHEPSCAKSIREGVHCGVTMETLPDRVPVLPVENYPDPIPEENATRLSHRYNPKNIPKNHGTCDGFCI